MDLFKRSGYKDIFNYLYTTKYKNELTFNEISLLDCDQRKFFDYLCIETPPEVFNLTNLPPEGDPIVGTSALFLELYNKIWKRQ